MGQYEVAMLFAFSMGYLAAACSVVVISWLVHRRDKDDEL